MQVRVLGSGSIAGKVQRNCSGYLVDERLLLDCGPGIWRALDNIGLNDKITVNEVFISHFHVDHIADLIPLLWSRHVLEIGQKEIFSIFGPIGTKLWFHKLTEAHRNWINELKLSIYELGDQNIELAGYAIKALPTNHTDHSICCKIMDRKRASLFYSGDSGWNDNLIKLAASCDLAILEASKASDHPVEDHLTPLLAAEVAHLAHVKILLLTHFYPEALAGNPLIEASTHFKGKIILAHDDLTVVF